jgi:outer membrane putative beta-barrel porin/alpha-amylase
VGYQRATFEIKLFLAFSLLFLLFPPTARGQLPFYTDDADTTDAGKFHFEFFNEQDILQKTLYPAKRQNNANFTLNYGLAKRVELDINAPLLTIFNANPSPLGNPIGIGDTQFGIKYRFYEERDGSRLPAMAVVFYLEAPTGSPSKQLGSGVTDYWLYGVAQKSLTKKTKCRLNAGILFAGNTSTGLVGIRTTKGKVFTGNSSITHDFTSKLRLGVEVFGAVTNNFQLSKGQLEIQVGGNYALNKQFALAFGVLGGRFPGSPRVGALLGFAYDFK